MMKQAGKLYVGPAGWDYLDWQGVVYPPGRPRGFDPLTQLSAWFNLVEINTSFYHIPPERHAQSWCARVRDAADFLFTAKLWRGFTHDGNWERRDVDAFRAFAQALADGGRLGCVLLQFPQSFGRGAESEARLARLVELFAGFPLALEVRHDSWLEGGAVLDWCAARGVAFCNIDQPALPRCIPPTAHATADFAYVRLHGRNAANWFAEDANAAARYDYLYRHDELNPWARRLRELIDRVGKVMAVANNHFRGQAVANALELRGALEEREVLLPGTLAAAYPQLLRVRGVKAEPEARQLELF